MEVLPLKQLQCWFQMGARYTWYVLGVLLMVCGLFGKLGAVLAIIPDPVIGGTVVVGLGMVTTVALSNVHMVDMKEPRNMMVLGVALILGMMLPRWVEEHPGVINTGACVWTTIDVDMRA